MDTKKVFLGGVKTTGDQPHLLHFKFNVQTINYGTPKWDVQEHEWVKAVFQKTKEAQVQTYYLSCSIHKFRHGSRGSFKLLHQCR